MVSIYEYHEQCRDCSVPHLCTSDEYGHSTAYRLQFQTDEEFSFKHMNI